MENIASDNFMFYFWYREDRRTFYDQSGEIAKFMILKYNYFMINPSFCKSKTKTAYFVNVAKVLSKYDFRGVTWKVRNA